MLLHIISVQYAPSLHLTGAVQYEDRIYLEEPVPWQTLPTEKLSSVKDSAAIEDEGVRHTVELKSTLSCDESPFLPGTNYAFLLHSADGHRFLLGSLRGVQPTVLTELSVPSSAGEVSAITLTVTRASRTPLLRVV